MPGAESVAASSAPPVNGLTVPTATLHVEGRTPPVDAAQANATNVIYFLVTENFFDTMKTPMVRGRDFDARDTAAAQWAVIINETLAHRFWPGEDPIGKRFTVDAVSGERPREVIGVVRDVPLRYVRTFPQPVAYALYRQQPERYQGLNAGMFGQMTFFIRTDGDPMRLAPSVRQAIADVDPVHPAAGFQTMAEFVGSDMRPRRFYVSTVGMFAMLATLLAAVGIYGVMSLSVSHRTREIGIRMALGARARDVVAAVGGRAFKSVLLGVLLGIIGALGSTQWLRAQLWGVEPTDPLTFAAVTALLVAVSAIACFIPARRAMRVDANVALRTE